MRHDPPHAPTDTEHDEWVKEHGRPYTDRWFPWLNRTVHPTPASTPKEQR